jgi:hypothetical protein
MMLHQIASSAALAGILMYQVVMKHLTASAALLEHTLM